MDYKHYEQKINDVINKCPIEAGIEILVYNVLDNIIESKDLSLVDINRIWKNKDKRLTTDGGVPDIAVLSRDFMFGTDTGFAYGFIEVKATNRCLSETEQIEGHKSSEKNYVYTNGLVWRYYRNKELKWELSLEKSGCKSIVYAQTISIAEEKFKELLDKLSEINWKE